MYSLVKLSAEHENFNDKIEFYAVEVTNGIYHVPFVTFNCTFCLNESKTCFMSVYDDKSFDLLCESCFESYVINNWSYYKIVLSYFKALLSYFYIKLMIKIKRG